MKARGLTREQVMNDVLLAAQPTKTVRHRRPGRGARPVPLPRRGRRDHRRQPQHGRRLDGASEACGAADGASSPMKLSSLSPARFLRPPRRSVVAGPPGAGWRGRRHRGRPPPDPQLARRLDGGAARRRATARMPARSPAAAPCSSPTRRSPDPAPPPGDYDCRTIKLGAPQPDLLDYVAYPAFRCRIRVRGGRLELHQADRLAAPGRPALPRQQPADGLPRHADARRRDAGAALRPRPRAQPDRPARAGRPAALAARLPLSAFRIPARRDRAHSPRR